MAEVTRGGAICEFILESYMPQKNNMNRAGNNDIRLVDSANSNGSYQVLYGDEMTWAQLETAKLLWGDSTKQLFTTPTTGWTYIYYCYGSLFVVTNADGKRVYSVNTRTIARFAISWDIFTSHQFEIVFNEKQGDRDYLIGTRRSKYSPFDVNKMYASDERYSPGRTYDSEVDPPWCDPLLQQTVCKSVSAQYCDKYYSDTLHHRMLHLGTTPEPITWTMSNELESKISFIQENPTILRSCVPVRSIKGDFSDVGVRTDEFLEPCAPTKKRQGNITIDMYMTLLLALINSNLYARRGNPVIAPWLLWKCWQWIAKATPTSSVDALFDILPNWG